jgi:hypothetical protein
LVGLSARTRSEWQDDDFDLAVPVAAKEQWAELLASVVRHGLVVAVRVTGPTAFPQGICPGSAGFRHSQIVLAATR